MLKYALLASTRCGTWSMSLFGCKDDISRVSCCVCPAGEATSLLTHGVGAGGTRSRTRGLLSPTLPLALLLPPHPMPTGSPLAPALSALALPGVLSWGSCCGFWQGPKPCAVRKPEDELRKQGGSAWDRCDSLLRQAGKGGGRGLELPVGAGGFPAALC